MHQKFGLDSDQGPSDWMTGKKASESLAQPYDWNFFGCISSCASSSPSSWYQSRTESYFDKRWSLRDEGDSISPAGISRLEALPLCKFLVVGPFQDAFMQVVPAKRKMHQHRHCTCIISRAFLHTLSLVHTLCRPVKHCLRAHGACISA